MSLLPFANESRFVKIEARLDHHDENFKMIEKRFDKIDDRLERLEAKFDAKFDAQHQVNIQMLTVLNNIALSLNVPGTKPRIS